MDRRRAGVLAHPTSLPGPGPSGDLGDGAVRFLDWLAAAGCTLWQVLPLGPTDGIAFSPYSSPSALALGTHLVSLDRLAADGLLSPDEARWPGRPSDRVDLEALRTWHAPRVRRAAERLAADAPAELEAFRAARPWVEEWALFRALSEEVAGAGWSRFPPALRDRDPAALAAARERLRDRVAAIVAEQLLARRQWLALRAEARRRGILLVGDLPIFVDADGCDTWVHRHLFRGRRDAEGRWVADPLTGVPPDPFAPDGQLWGNPHYDWPAHRAEGFRWWSDRLAALLELVDAVRIDHFRGFAAAWEVPRGRPAAEGRWAPGPGLELFEALRARVGGLPVVAEDLGRITPDVVALREALGIPGMKVLQFAFGGDDDHPYLPHTWEHPRWVVYTGTHDNDTAIGWYASADERTRHRFRVYVGRGGSEPGWDLVRLAWSSIARWAVVPLQDLLGLGPEARMNVPGRAEGNWRWRASGLPAEPALRLAEWTRAYGRAPR